DHRIDDQLVARAAADVAGEQVAHPGARRGIVAVVDQAAIDDVGRAHRDPRGADAALRAAARDEGALHGVKQLAAREALDGGDLARVALADRDHARVDGLAVEPDRARAALALAAALLGAGEPQVLAQHVEQAAPRRALDGARLAVDLERDLHGASQRGRLRATSSGEIGSSSNAQPSASSTALATAAA